MPKTEDFREELQAQIQRAQRQGRPHVEVNSGELHRTLGGYPPKAGGRSANTIPSCCAVMWAEHDKGQGEGGVSDRQRPLGFAHHPLPPAASVNRLKACHNSSCLCFAFRLPGGDPNRARRRLAHRRPRA